MSKIRKRQILGLIVFACLLMVLLAVSLPALQMQPGKYIYFPLQTTDQAESSSSQNSENPDWYLILTRLMVTTLIILLPIYILISLLRRESRKKLLVNAIAVAIISLFILLVMWLFNIDTLFNQSNELVILQPGVEGLPDLELEPITFPNFNTYTKPWMLLLTIIGVAVLIASAAFLTFKLFSNQSIVDHSAYLEIAENAQAALDEIEETKIDFDDIIIRCYAEMSQTLQSEKGIQRDQGMTTYEFQQELLARGFPARPIQRLTHLFGQVRYGRQQLMESEKKVAVESLDEIIEYCRGQV